MKGLINTIFDNLEIDVISRVKAKEALFYINFLIGQEDDINEKTNLYTIKNKILERIVYLDGLQTKKLTRHTHDKKS